MSKKELSEEERQLVESLKNSLYTVSFLEEWINRNDNVFVNAPAALQAAAAKGFYQAIHRMSEMRYQISREVQQENLETDVIEYLCALWESQNLEDWKYEYMRTPKIMQLILQKYGKLEDCNVSYNATLESAYEMISKTITLNDDVLESLWKSFGEIPVDDDGVTEEDFIGYPAGTHREEIWHWFDEHHTKGVASLMGLKM